jgi:hypothetical protein
MLWNITSESTHSLHHYGISKPCVLPADRTRRVYLAEPAAGLPVYAAWRLSSQTGVDDLRGPKLNAVGSHKPFFLKPYGIDDKT